MKMEPWELVPSLDGVADSWDVAMTRKNGKRTRIEFPWIRNRREAEAVRDALNTHERPTIGLGRDIQGWLIRGMEHIAINTPTPEALEMQAFLALLRRAQLVTLVVDESTMANCPIESPDKSLWLDINALSDGACEKLLRAARRFMAHSGLDSRDRAKAIRAELAEMAQAQTITSHES